jgi:hypothetical protein
MLILSPDVIVKVDVSRNALRIQTIDKGGVIVDNFSIQPGKGQ